MPDDPFGNQLLHDERRRGALRDFDVLSRPLVANRLVQVSVRPSYEPSSSRQSDNKYQQ